MQPFQLLLHKGSWGKGKRQKAMSKGKRAKGKRQKAKDKNKEHLPEGGSASDLHGHLPKLCENVHFLA